MIPFQPWNSATRYYQAWRKDIKTAKESTPLMSMYYCHAAVLHQAFYVIHQALDMYEFHKKVL